AVPRRPPPGTQTRTIRLWLFAIRASSAPLLAAPLRIPPMPPREDGPAPGRIAPRGRVTLSLPPPHPASRGTPKPPRAAPAGRRHARHASLATTDRPSPADASDAS